MVIGIDFDNTIVCYDKSLREEALRRGWLPGFQGVGKRQIREAIRQLADGEEKWRALQAVVYGPRMREGGLAPGVVAFFQACRSRGIPLRIVSHKTQHPADGNAAINFWKAALSWMEAHRFFEADGFGVKREEVYFEPTRARKIQQIRVLACTHVIDDLEETFLEPGFPVGVEKILYAPDGDFPEGCRGIRVFRTWEQIHDHLFCTVA